MKKTLVLFLALTALHTSNIFALEDIHLQMKWKHQFQFAGYYAAIKQGFYSNRGLNVILHEGVPGYTSIHPLMSKKVQYAVDMPSVLIINQEKRNLVALAAIFQHSPVALYSLKSKNIKTIHDIIGKRVMLPNRYNTELLVMFQSEGISFSDFTVQELQWGLDHLINNKTDLVTGYVTEMPYKFRLKGLEYNEIQPLDYGLDFYGDCLLTTKQEILFHPQRVEKFLEASLLGWKYAMDHKDEMIKYILSHYSTSFTYDALKFEADEMEKLILPDQIDIGHMSPMRWKFMADTYLSLGLISSNYTLDEFLYSYHARDKRSLYFIFFGLAAGGLLVFILALFWNRQLSTSVSRSVLEAKKNIQNYTEIFNSTSDAIFIHDAASFKILDVNQSMLEMYGYDSIDQVLTQEYIENTFCDAPYDMEQAHKYLQQTKEQGPQLFEWCTKKRSGEKFWVEISLKLSHLSDTDIILAVVRDISERKYSEQALKETQENYQAIFNSSTSAVFVHDSGTGDILEVNDSMLKLYGLKDRNELTGKTLKDFISEEKDYTLDDALIKINDSIEKGPQTFEWRSRKITGELFWSEVTLKFYQINGKGRVLAVVRNINERKEIDQVRSQNAYAMEAFIESLPGMAMLMDKDLNIILVNEAMCRSIKTRKEDVMNLGMEKILPPEVYKQRVKNVKKVFQSGTPYHWEDQRNNRFFSNYISPILNEASQVESLALFTQDITEKKIYEKYNTRLATALEQSAEAISIITKEGMVEYINSAFEKILGYKKDSVIGKPPFYILKHVWDEETALTPEQAMEKREVWKGLIKHQTEEGPILDLNTSITPIHKSDEHMGWVTIQKDETQLRKLSADLRQSQKMEAIGTLAGGIAHDFNNILMGIMGYTEMAQMISQDNESLKDYLGQVYQSSVRAKELVEQILAFSRKSDYSKRSLQLKNLIHEAVKLLRSSIPATVKIVTEFHSEKSILANVTQIHQIIMNLCTNAYHAMPSGGTLTINISERNTKEIVHEEIIKTDIEQYLVIRISDTGKGMDSTLLSHIFEPYFTTKVHGRGTGMGLAVVQGIVKNHDGFIEVKSEVDKGTDVFVYLPAIKDRPEVDISSSATLQKNESSYHILFVDDELTIVNLVQQYLETKGHKVTCFSDSSEAEQAIKADLDSFDIVISDVTMPYMTGIDLLKLIRSQDKNKPVILCSGNASVLLDEKEDCLFLEKPMNLSELDNLIQEAMKF